MIVGIIMAAGTLLGELMPDFPDGAVYADAFDETRNGAPAHQPGLCHVNGFRHCFRRV